MNFALGIFGAAMLAEPAVTDVEEVVGLIHEGCQVLGVRCRVPSAGCQVPGARCQIECICLADTRRLVPS